MIDFTLESRFDRSPADVFAYVSDPERLPTWQTNTVSSVPDGPMGVGTRLREVHRAPGGKEIATLVEVSEWVPDQAFGLRMVEGSPPIHAQLHFSPSDEASRMAKWPLW